MSENPPAPDWWLASDGQWYPPQWEYRWFTKESWNKGLDVAHLNPAMQAAVDEATALGRQGWEMVNYTTTWVTFGPESQARDNRPHWVVSCFMKRMVRV